MNYDHKLNLAAVTLLLLSGCGSYKALNMYAHSTVGLNVDRDPPNARIGITREEEVVTPAFANGQKPNVAAGFNVSYNPIKRLLFSVSSFFAGGEAATNLTDCRFRPQADNNSPQCAPTDSPSSKEAMLAQQRENGSILCFKVRPEAPNLETFKGFGWLNSLQDHSFPDEGKSKLFVFTSDTTFGVKANWQGTDIFPNKLDAGFNRKESVHAPIIIKESLGEAIDGCPAPGFTAKIASYFSYINLGDVKPIDTTQNSELWFERLTGIRFGYNQLFATGKAAENLTKDPDMQNNFRALFLEHAGGN